MFLLFLFLLRYLPGVGVIQLSTLRLGSVTGYATNDLTTN